ncbi:MAG: HpcH/HpaI aldolase family protein [Candidatus Dormibacteria bacterium]
MAAWLNVPWPPLAEIFGSCGLDAALIDMEHTTNDFAQIESLIIACECAGVTPLVRPAALDTHAVNRLLDAGAQGIIFADIRTRGEAELAAACTKYPPAGRRGWGGSHTRYAMWEGLPAAAALRETTVEGRGVYSGEYVQKANDDVLTFLIVESPEGVANIDAIASVKGIDAISFGWADFSVQSDFRMEEIEAAADRVYAACRSRGVGTSLSVGQAGNSEYFPGCYFIAGIDTLIISGAIRTILTDARRTVEAARG